MDRSLNGCRYHAPMFMGRVCSRNLQPDSRCDADCPCLVGTAVICATRVAIGEGDPATVDDRLADTSTAAAIQESFEPIGSPS